MRDLFDYNILLTSLDLSNFESNKVEKMDGKFYHCSNLTFIDISNLVINSNVDYRGIFYGLPSSGKIIYNKKIISEFKNSPSNWEIIIKNE